MTPTKVLDPKELLSNVKVKIVNDEPRITAFDNADYGLGWFILYRVIIYLRDKQTYLKYRVSSKVKSATLVAQYPNLGKRINAHK